MIEEFPHLHLHTTHSHLDAYGTVDSFHKKASEMGMSAIGHTEHGNISGWPQAQLAGIKYGIKPIFGIEAYVVPDHAAKKRGYNHLTLLACNNQGLKNLFDLVSRSFREGFYYKPRMSWNDILRQSEGLYAFSGCWSGFAARHIVHDIKNPTADSKTDIPTRKQVKDWLNIMKKKFKGRFFMELMPLVYELQKPVLSHEIEIAEECGIPFVATNDVHYIEPEHFDCQDDLVCIRSNSSKKDEDRMCYDVDDLFMKTKERMSTDFETLGIDKSISDLAISNSYMIANDCTAEIPNAQPVKYHAVGNKALDVDVEGKTSIEEIFSAVLRYMWDKREIPKTKKYTSRVKEEYELLRDKGFLDYILIIWDLIWAAKNRPEEDGGPILVGPARGSSAGSLVCYILSITELDPFVDDLIFARFVDPNRYDLPDIDIDFPDDQRDWAKEYLKQRWGGDDHVGNLISHAIFKGKIAMTDIGRIYRIPKWATEKVKSLLVERSSGDARASFTIEDTFKEFPEAKEICDKYPDLLLSGRLEGQIRHQGTHAAGIVISTEEPLKNIGAFYRDGSFWMDKKDAEKFGHLKIDLLGLNTLTVLREAAKNIGIEGGDMLDFYYKRIPMDDKDTILAFEKCDVDGIFQFEGQAQMAVTKQLRPNNYVMVRDLTALSRPGPLHCGGTESYIRRSKGEEYIIDPPEIDSVVKDSFGVIIYQEQVMNIMRTLGKMSWAEIEDIRRLISKSVGVEYFNKFKGSFMKGAINITGIPEDVAEKIWDQMCTFGSWAFNRAHAASYTRLSIWSMYMKVHHPKAYLAAVAGYSSSEDRKSRAIREFQRRYGSESLLPVDVNSSKTQFGLEEGCLRPGLSDIKGVGTKASEAIISAAPFSSMDHFLESVPLRTVNKRVRRVLHALGAFRSLEGADRDARSVEIEEYKSQFKDLRAIGHGHCFWVLPVNFAKVRRWAGGCTPLKDVEERSFPQHNIKVIGRIRKINQRDYRELGSEDMMKKIRPGDETRFVNITIEDEESFMMVTVPRHNYKKMKGIVFSKLSEGAILYGKGTVLTESRRLFLNELGAIVDD